MAKQKGLFPFTGTIGNLTGWQGKNGVFYVKEKSTLNGEKIARNPNMAPQRKEMKYFGLASAAAKEIRQALFPTLEDFADSLLHGRLTEACKLALRCTHPSDCPRNYDFIAAAEYLQGYPLAKECLSRFCQIQNLITDTDDLGWRELNIEGWYIPNYLLAKASATHLRWIVVGSVS